MAQTAGDFPHLPPGRAPGLQSRRRRTARRILVPAMGCAGVAWLVFTVPIALFASDLPVWLYFFPLGGLLFLYAAYAIWRQGKPRVAEQVELRTSATELARGDTVHATARLLEPLEGDGRVEVGLVCTEWWDVWEDRQTADNERDRARHTNEAVAFEQWQPLRSTQETLKFTIPPDAPFSHEGTCVSFGWRLTARIPEAARTDPARHQPIWVLP